MCRRDGELGNVGYGQNSVIFRNTVEPILLSYICIFSNKLSVTFSQGYHVPM